MKDIIIQGTRMQGRRVKNLYIIGASGHGKVVADIAIHLNRYDNIFFMDDDDSIKEIMNLAVIGKTNCYDLIDLEKDEIIVAIGNAVIRKRIQTQYEERGYALATLIHPNAVIGMEVSIGAGTVIMPGSIINANTQIGKGCIINTSSSIDHDCQIGDYVHVAVGAHLCGNVKIGESTWIGAGGTISNNIIVCEECVIGAGAVVVRNILEQGKYIGLPARKYGSV